MESHLGTEIIYLKLFPSISLLICIFKRSIMLLSFGVWLEQTSFPQQLFYSLYSALHF